MDWEARAACAARVLPGIVAFLLGRPGGADIRERVFPTSPEGPQIRMLARGRGAKVKKEMSSLVKSS